MNSSNGGPKAFGAFDATWIMTSSIIIFTMQTGFGVGLRQPKERGEYHDEKCRWCHPGGTHWMFGYAVQYGNEKGNPFWGTGTFFDDDDVQSMGEKFSTFIFQLLFATTATTIVSGAMAERTNYNAYCLFSLTNTTVYCVPAGWVWGAHGFLKKLGAIDYAGILVYRVVRFRLHLLGEVSALVAAMILGPRRNRYDEGYAPPVGHPINVIQGTFFLWLIALKHCIA
ncbi:ammonium transporter-like [Tropilaelaps mercedesae]|uniref:Ammonium transporter-like n=1 Tax=Tropilaelaps mercedesae TaxID=418985 RepID=A0A1V9Y2F2_9ACAR|nr:ammonium transporter-like [Tropilaelaps mercedesae]